MSDQRKEKLITVRGVVTEALPSTLFRVMIPVHNASGIADVGVKEGEDLSAQPEEKEILAYLSGKMRMHRIKVLIGDSVEIVLDSYGGKGRIIKRF
jgi:translation initiation factor IF-1